MTTIELNTIQSGEVSAVAEQEGGKPRTRGKDDGPTTLPHLEHLVHITRKVQRPMLLRVLLESALGQVLPAAQALSDAAKGSLPIPSRNVLFALVRVAILCPYCTRMEARVTFWTAPPSPLRRAIAVLSAAAHSASRRCSEASSTAAASAVAEAS